MPMVEEFCGPSRPLGSPSWFAAHHCEKERICRAEGCMGSISAPTSDCLQHALEDCCLIAQWYSRFEA